MRTEPFRPWWRHLLLLIVAAVVALVLGRTSDDPGIQRGMMLLAWIAYGFFVTLATPAFWITRGSHPIVHWNAYLVAGISSVILTFSLFANPPPPWAAPFSVFLRRLLGLR